ncbi:MAG: hypothetical protein AMJ54_14810 [Deltaproteobacteria bacterium SG8_13]|nr:MAG: hypothetical protein AMJ54_14810 [Deltaproteobacteria bacterium SG8_13]
MILLLATPLSIYTYCLKSGKLETLVYGKGDFYGISWQQDAIYISSSNLDAATLLTESDYRKSGVGTVTRFSEEGHQIVCSGISQPHQILVDTGGNLLVTNTGYNTVDIVNFNTDQKYRLNLSETKCEVVGHEKLGNHFNSLYDHDGSYYIVAHNNSRDSEVYKIDKAQGSVTHKYKTDAQWAHNVWICEHGMIICDSKNGSLYEVYGNHTIWKADEAPIITRGLAATEDYIFIGRSEYGNRFSRRYSDGGFWIVDRKTLKTLETVKLENTGCINELRLFGRRDDCHPAPVMERQFLVNLKQTPLFYRLRRNTDMCYAKVRNSKQRLTGHIRKRVPKFLSPVFRFKTKKNSTQVS